MPRSAILVPTLLALFSAFPHATADETRVAITVEKPARVVATTKPPFEGRRPTVDVAILLDTSNSMDGLIAQAKNQLWTIVQQFAKAQKNGQTPILRVSLFEYGNTRLPASEGYIRQVEPLTDDLDKLSESLFTLTTSGGDEYCGQVIDEAVSRLGWSKEPGGYKAIFIAGNEPFSQGSVDYRQACKRAIEHGVVVNTIHCGGNQAGVEGKWRHGAQLAEGKFFNIDQDRAVVHIDCPQDEMIIKLNAELNKTYLWYGEHDRRDYYASNQAAQDENAARENPSAGVSRGGFKATRLYRNVHRDLVDTLREDSEILEKVDKEHLPEELQQLSLEDRKAYVERFAARRLKLKQEIQSLAAEREEYLAQQRAQRADATNEGTLGTAIVSAIGQQLADAGFEQDGEQH